ncbi:MAG: N-formylglutamate amidohydrolase [Hyphomicrobiaceae bacterium]
MDNDASQANAASPSFELIRPERQTAAFVFSSPHSGRRYPADFLAASRLDAMSLRKSEDCFVDQLFSGMPALGAPLIAALFPRAYLDLNREPYELDPELVSDPLPSHANTQSVRVAGGLGTVARIVADGEEIYENRLPLTTVMARIERLYFPFHAALASLIEETQAQFGFAVLIDCHSMPSTAAVAGGGARPDIVIGDRYGASCDPNFARAVRDSFLRAGYDVQMNRPYAGGYITEHHGKPTRGIHALQIEINRGLYLDERRLVASKGFSGLRADLETIFQGLISSAHEMFGPYSAAAE